MDLVNDGFVLMQGPSSRGRDRSNQFNMNWAVREMPFDRSHRRYQRWLSENNPNTAEYISLNQTDAPVGRKRGTPTVTTLCSITESQAKLARSAALCIKEVGSILKPDVFENVPVNQRDAVINSIETVLAPVWNWILSIMDWTEAQLRYGTILNKHGELKEGKAELKRTTKTKHRQSHDFLTYALSLLRQGSSEHADLLPSVDISSLKVNYKALGFYLTIMLHNLCSILLSYWTP